MKKYINMLIVIMIGISIIAGGNTSMNAAGDTIGDVFADDVLKACVINNAYGKGFTEDTPIEDAANYYNATLACSNVNGRAKDLTGIDRLTKIHTVQLIGANIQDFTPLKNMTQLTKIDASNNGITDDVLATLEGANLPNLTILTLNNNKISDLSPIADLTSITMLNLRTNNISDIEPLKDMTGMWDLNLGYNNVSDLTPVENMPSIYRLYFADNQVESLEPLRGTQTLGTLQFSNNKITDLSPIEENINLFNIMADGNKISQISPEMYDIVKDFSHFAYFNNQAVELSEVSISNNQVVIDNPIKVNGNFVMPTNISDGGTVSPDNSKITWNFSGVVPQQVSFDFSEVVNPGGDGTRTLSGNAIVPLAEYFTVSYNSNGGSAVADEVVRKDALATMPAIPTKTDFDFEGWYEDSALSQQWDFNTAITRDMTLYAKWTPKVTTANYKVEHYQEQTDGTYKLKDTETLSGLINATVNASPKTYTGYTYDSTISGTKVSGTVAGDGSLTLKLYYKANIVVNKNASYKVEHYLKTNRWISYIKRYRKSYRGNWKNSNCNYKDI
ncbi:InlB B-repeat-containing protein [Breznakia pachnodae]|uniref:Repeat protein (TIGR02543 family) n=1 Tax=Breznakia pachnodae TaxID=265178 RepID=A0ABU0E0P8_9FIRM|nr:InlB B-repeat-containing protein [Breznakia pachnodae]MDQ0360448.1 putative repeat protein (TIGR02543 family) [Breznakia pachnodae]